MSPPRKAGIIRKELRCRRASKQLERYARDVTTWSMVLLATGTAERISSGAHNGEIKQSVAIFRRFTCGRTDVAWSRNGHNIHDLLWIIGFLPTFHHCFPRLSKAKKHKHYIPLLSGIQITHSRNFYKRNIARLRVSQRCSNTCFLII